MHPLDLNQHLRKFYALHKLPRKITAHLWRSRQFDPELNSFPNDGRPEWSRRAPYRGIPPLTAKYDYSPQTPISMRTPSHPFFGSTRTPFQFGGFPGAVGGLNNAYAYAPASTFAPAWNGAYTAAYPQAMNVVSSVSPYNYAYMDPYGPMQGFAPYGFDVRMLNDI